MESNTNKRKERAKTKFYKSVQYDCIDSLLDKFNIDKIKKKDKPVVIYDNEAPSSFYHSDENLIFLNNYNDKTFYEEGMHFIYNYYRKQLPTLDYQTMKNIYPASYIISESISEPLINEAIAFYASKHFCEYRRPIFEKHLNMSHDNFLKLRNKDTNYYMIHDKQQELLNSASEDEILNDEFQTTLLSKTRLDNMRELSDINLMKSSKQKTINSLSSDICEMKIQKNSDIHRIFRFYVHGLGYFAGNQLFEELDKLQDRGIEFVQNVLLTPFCHSNLEMFVDMYTLKK